MVSGDVDLSATGLRNSFSITPTEKQQIYEMDNEPIRRVASNAKEDLRERGGRTDDVPRPYLAHDGRGDRIRFQAP